MGHYVGEESLHQRHILHFGPQIFSAFSSVYAGYFVIVLEDEGVLWCVIW
jgi:hypothetical protein